MHFSGHEKGSGEYLGGVWLHGFGKGMEDTLGLLKIYYEDCGTAVSYVGCCALGCGENNPQSSLRGIGVEAVEESFRVALVVNGGSIVSAAAYEGHTVINLLFEWK